MEGELNVVKVINKQYNKHGLLSPCSDIILEAKRVILNEDLDKIIDVTLSTMHDCAIKIHSKNRECQKDLKWNEENFWENLPPPQNLNKRFIASSNASNKSCSKLPHNQEISEKILSVQKKTKDFFSIDKRKIHSGDKMLLRKYFNFWVVTVKRVKEKRKAQANKNHQKEKLQKFLKTIKKINKEEKISKNNNATDKNKKVETNVVSKQTVRDPLKESLRNRFEAQKSIISQQKAKLEQQNKLIEDLKLGIIKEDLLKSSEDIKNEIREIFSDCSHNSKKLIHLVPEREQLTINSKKVPKFVQKMEERAIERAKKREIILKRKQLIEEKHKKSVEEAAEKKKIQDEEERKRNLEILKEKQRKELEIAKIRQSNRLKYLEKVEKVTEFYKRNILKKFYETWKNYYFSYKANEAKSVVFYETNLEKKVFKNLSDLIAEKYKKKFEISRWLYEFKLRRCYFRKWFKVYEDGIKNAQIADDFYDFRLTSKFFKYWHLYVCAEYVSMDKKTKIAAKHYDKKVLFCCFFQWKSLPTVLLLEKVKEEKKRKWRDRVWEILPDYEPPNDF